MSILLIVIVFNYISLAQKHNIRNIFLITPRLMTAPHNVNSLQPNKKHNFNEIICH